MKKTKIVCTIGPASEDRETLTEMIKTGMNVARLNFSHGTHEEHQRRIDLIKEIRKELNIPVAILLDTKGPEIRTGRFEKEEIN
jgi:pyruvate kinase